MTLRMMSEAVARREWAGDMTVVREDRDLLNDMKVFGARTGAALLILFPLWRPDAPLFNFLNWFCLLLIAAGLIYYSVRLSLDLKAARKASAWLMAFSRDRLWLNMRSYRHGHWLRGDKTVIALERGDIASICGVRISGVGITQLSVRLEEVVMPEVVESLMNENTRLEKGRFGYKRHDHQPLRLEENGQVFRVMFGKHRPTLNLVLDKLRLNYMVEPPRGVPHPEAHLLENRMELTDALVAEAVELVRAGKKIEAVRYIRARTGLSLRDCKSIADQMENEAP